MNLEKLKQDLIRSEGLRLKPYRDIVGKLTIGVGRNLDDKGISEAEAIFLLENDIRHVLDAVTEIEGFAQLSTIRQHVIVEMAFNLGVGGMQKFKRMWVAIWQRNWAVAADEMLTSRWATQVGRRAQWLAHKMKYNTEEDFQ